jgi:cyclopropane fatty-acyl-phospholipid synthase-like methyltransferase
MVQSSHQHLDLYARVEHLLGIEEATYKLHQVYIDLLDEYKINSNDIKSVLDLGCGRGLLIEKLLEKKVEASGIDLSGVMVNDAKAKNLEVQLIDIADYHDKKFDAIVAVFDVLNFISPTEINEFLNAVSDSLNDGGYFIADVNSLHGFSDVAEGVMSVDMEDSFLNIDAIFDENILRTTFTLFEKKSEKEGDSFTKDQDEILQYFHPMKLFRQQKSLKLIKNYAVSLYDEDDKTLLIFKK